MAQKVTGYIKLQIPAAKATASPPVGPALGQHGVNISQFIKEFNERTKDQAGFKIPVVITVYADRSFSFVTKTPPTPTLILKALGIEKGSGVPNKDKVATITKAQVKEIAERKMPDLTANTIEAAMSQVAGTCRSMGIELGSAQCGNNILLGALCASGLLPFGFEALEEGIRTFMPAKLVDVNLKAAERGREILASSRLF